MMKGKFSQSGFAPIILLVVIATAIVIAGGFAYLQLKPEPPTTQPTPPPIPSTTDETTTPADETADWKIYTGKYFSFKYPPEWTDNTGPAATYPQNLEVIGLRISPNAVFEAAYRDINYDEALQSLAGRKSQHITLDGREAKRFDKAGQGTVMPRDYSIIAIIVKGTDDTSFSIGFNGDNNDITEALIGQILSTFKFLDEIISKNNTSPDGSFVVTEEAVGDHQIITVKDNQGNTIVGDLVKTNHEEIGYNVKFGCICGTHFKGWVSNSRFAIQIVNGGGEEYEYLVDAVTGRVDEETFKRIK